MSKKNNEIIIAVTGCVHGKIEKVYEKLESIKDMKGIEPELVICTGDFEATRDVYDLESMTAPEKYMVLGTFYKYYTGEKKAPYLTIVIGGNHESSRYSWELFYGGWLCPNIYYLGVAGVVNYRGLRIVGLSGIYKQNSYNSCLLLFSS